MKAVDALASAGQSPTPNWATVHQLVLVALLAPPPVTLWLACEGSRLMLAGALLV